mmetsp:Transcript_27552/g.89740  ORF Transcript_27552/g.89740 Transcript_27552/m.89740 type:complete len:86 (-) Transcript_27552:75-332(-)
MQTSLRRVYDSLNHLLRDHSKLQRSSRSAAAGSKDRMTSLENRVRSCGVEGERMAADSEEEKKRASGKCSSLSSRDVGHDQNLAC